MNPIFDSINDLILKVESEVKSLRKSSLLLQKKLCENPEYVESCITRALDHIPPSMLSENLVRILQKKKIPIHNCASFSLLNSIRIHRNYVCGFNNNIIPIHDKMVGRELANHLGFITPRKISEVSDIESIDFKENCMLKPIGEAGGKGVYYIFSKNNIIPVKKGKKLTSFAALRDRILCDLEAGVLKSNKFFLEEVIYEDVVNKIPGRDIKFFMFYGEIGIVLENVKKPNLRRCWFDSKSNLIETGKYQDKKFQGVGFNKSLADEVCRLSAMLPVPFMRIDLIKSHDDKLVLGEFSPKPAGYDLYNAEIDQFLGSLFLDAEARLAKDLILRNNKFNEFLGFI